MKVFLFSLFIAFLLSGCATIDKRAEAQVIPIALKLHKEGNDKEKENALLALERFVGLPTENLDLRKEAREYITSIKEVCPDHKTRKKPTPPSYKSGEGNIIGNYPPWCNVCFNDITYGDFTHNCSKCDYDRCAKCNDSKDWEDVGEPYSETDIRILKLEWQVAALQREQNLLRQQNENARFMRNINNNFDLINSYNGNSPTDAGYINPIPY